MIIGKTKISPLSKVSMKNAFDQNLLKGICLSVGNGGDFFHLFQVKILEF